MKDHLFTSNSKEIRLFYSFLLRCFAIIIPFLAASYIINLYLHKSIQFHTKAKILISGDSHAKCDINPTLIPGSQNIAMQGELFVFEYEKLALILKNNTGIKTIIMSFPYHSLSYKANEIRLINPLRFDTYFDYYYPVINKEDLKASSVTSEKYYRKVVNNLISPDIDYYKNALYSEPLHKKMTFPYIGSFETFNKNILDTERLNKEVKTDYPSKEDKHKFSEASIFYLKKIAELAADKKITLILLTTPLHSSYYKLIPPEFLEKHKQLSEELSKLPKVKCLNFATLNLPDRYFLNEDHLNKEGAEYFTKLLNGIISKE